MFEPDLVPGDEAGVAFDSTDNGVRVEFGPWTQLQTFTIEVWVRPAKVTYRESGVLVDKGNAWNLTIQADGKPWFAIPFRTTRAAGEASLEIGRLYHLIGVYTGTEIALYVDGERVARSQTAPIELTTQPIHFGRGLSLGRFQLEGVLGNVALYDRVLTADRIRAHHEAGR